MPGFRTGWNLPPGVTDRMIDEAAGGYDEPPLDDEEEPEQEELVTEPTTEQKVNEIHRRVYGAHTNGLPGETINPAFFIELAGLFLEEMVKANESLAEIAANLRSFERNGLTVTNHY